MWTSSVQMASVAALIALSSTACGEDVGTASEPVTVAYCLRNAHTDVGTVHFDGPGWVLGSAEGIGPMVPSVRINVFVQPGMSTSGSFQLDPSAVSSTAGFSMAERYQIISGARGTIPDRELERLEAYTAYQRTVWEIRDPTCEQVLGYGTVYKPIGAYFRLVPTTDVVLPDPPVIVGGEMYDTPVCGGPGLPPPSATRDAGTPDAGQSDGGALDAGGSAAGGSDGG